MLFTNQTEQSSVLDPVVASSSQESLSIIISITTKCLSQESSRPSIEDVLWNLQYAAQVQATADGDQRSDIISQAWYWIRECARGRKDQILQSPSKLPESQRSNEQTPEPRHLVIWTKIVTKRCQRGCHSLFMHFNSCDFVYTPECPL